MSHSYKSVVKILYYLWFILKYYRKSSIQKQETSF
jgi:hypothetical protein